MPFLISTTPLEALRPDLRNRVIVTSIDESEEQTRRILQFETMMARDGVYAKKLRDEAELYARRLAGYFRELKPAYVVVPFAEKLYERLSFHTTKLRRDWKKLLALLQASALLFQHERKVEEVDGVRVVYADHRDLRNLIAIMPAFAQTLQNLTEPQRRLLSLLSTEFAVTTRQIAQAALQSGWPISPRRIRQILEELEALGYVVVDRESREHKYLKLRDAPQLDFETLISELEGQTSTRDISGNAEVSGNSTISESISAPEAAETRNSEESPEKEIRVCPVRRPQA
jgi:hypothetical protein